MTIASIERGGKKRSLNGILVILRPRSTGHRETADEAVRSAMCAELMGYTSVLRSLAYRHSVRYNVQCAIRRRCSE